MSASTNIKFWGVRGSTPCANIENMHFGGNTTCVQISIPGQDEMLVIDCGTGLRNLGNAIEEENGNLNGSIYITHPHWDHLQGFPFFKPLYCKGNEFNVYIPPQGDAGCKDILQGHMSNTFFPVSIDMLEAKMDCTTFEKGMMHFDAYDVEYMWANHTIDTAIFKFHIGGKAIIFAPDNELPVAKSDYAVSFLKEFRSFIHGADVLIHDAQFNMEQYEQRVGWGHSAWEVIVDIAREEKVSHLYLTHHDPDSTDKYLNNLEATIRERFEIYFDQIALAREGQEIILSYDS
ncbi:MBL fold metallo-hydrolase [Balneola sp. MJW-20]|uniref:MBL fold metallo-hydrolase n=1 Tax=Gracilimonas aurantiaca TaxID=3234185 RepID=UPI0034654971